MTTPRTLIVPLDGSELGESALPWAVRLAQAHDLQLLLVEAVEWPPAALLGGVEGGLTPGVYEEIVEEEETGASEYLLDVRKRLAVEGVPVQIAVRDGVPGRKVLDLADERGAFAICMATHARGGVMRRLHGSVAGRVLRDSTHPVFLVPARASQSWRRPPSLSRLLVPLDGSSLAERAVNAAREIATPGATITLVRVVDLVDEAIQVEKDGALHFGTTRHAVELEEDYLDEVADRLGQDGFHVHTSVRIGTDWREIVAATRDEDVDLVVMATDGRTGLAAWAVGSGVDQVLRHEDRPIFLVSPTAVAANPELNAAPRHRDVPETPRSARA